VQIPRLREWRERRALTQVELAESAGVSERSVAGYEAGSGARPPTVRRLAQALSIEVTDLYGDPEHPLGEAPPSQEKLFNNGVLEEERRARYQRSWRDFITLLANRIASQADTKGYEPAWILEISEIPRDITRVLFDNGVLGNRDAYPTEAEYRGSWEISDALEELDRAVEQAWRAQMREAERLERAREADQLTARRKQRQAEDRSRKEALDDIRAERGAGA
jgi:transcriptional regulator with XRE-family HTH domain